MPIYNLDAKNFSKKKQKYLIIYDDTNNNAKVYSKKANLELGIDEFTINNIQDKLKTIKTFEETIVIALGGDGFLLRVIHLFIDFKNIKFYGVNFGTIGFLLNNKTSTQEIINKIETAEESKIYPLNAKIIKTNKTELNIVAINEISFLRQTNQASNFEIIINDVLRLKSLVSDGLLISTPAGSTAYNFSVHGPIFHPSSHLLNICPISSFRPRHWRGALIKDDSEITINVLQRDKRPTSISGDFYFESDVLSATIKMDKTKPIILLFNKEKTLSDKILEEQFLV